MTEPTLSADPLSFDRADVAADSAHMACANCSAAITSTYYGWNTASICPSCHEQLSQQHRKSGSFFRAFIFGAGAAAAGALLYYGIALATNMEFGLIAIVVGIAVGKAVRMGAGGRGIRSRVGAHARGLVGVARARRRLPRVRNGGHRAIRPADLV